MEIIGGTYPRCLLGKQCVLLEDSLIDHSSGEQIRRNMGQQLARNMSFGIFTQTHESGHHERFFLIFQPGHLSRKLNKERFKVTNAIEMNELGWRICSVTDGELST